MNLELRASKLVRLLANIAPPYWALFWLNSEFLTLNEPNIANIAPPSNVALFLLALTLMTLTLELKDATAEPRPALQDVKLVSPIDALAFLI